MLRDPPKNLRRERIARLPALSFVRLSDPHAHLMRTLSHCEQPSQRHVTSSACPTSAAPIATEAPGAVVAEEKTSVAAGVAEKTAAVPATDGTSAPVAVPAAGCVPAPEA